LKSDNDSEPPFEQSPIDTSIEPETVPEACEGNVIDVLNPEHEAVMTTPPNDEPAYGSRLTAVKLICQLADTPVLDTALNDGVPQLCEMEARGA
jgi:hypothetical protein